MGIYAENFTTFKVSQLHLKKDHTFSYIKVNAIVSIRSEGTWKMINDTLITLKSNKQKPKNWTKTIVKYNSENDKVVIYLKDSLNKPLRHQNIMVYAKDYNSKGLAYQTSNDGSIYINNNRITIIDSLLFDNGKHAPIHILNTNKRANEFHLFSAKRKPIDIHYRFFENEEIYYDKKNMLIYLDSNDKDHFYYLLSKY